MKEKKKAIRLQARIIAWEKMRSGMDEYKQRQRMESGGYKCPGSRKRTS